jgi:hypothetical protein
MLNRTEVLEHVKEELAAPFMTIEMSDEDILKEINKKALRKFSKYIPDIGNCVIDPTDLKYRGENNHQFKIFDNDNRPILSIKEAIFNSSELYFFGHSHMGVFDYEELPSKLLNYDAARATYNNSVYKKFYRFIHPNIIRVDIPKIQHSFKVIYERMHSENYDTIPTQYEDLFLDMALAVLKIKIGTIRSVYTNINTVYGTVELNGEQLKQEGRDEIREIEEKLQTYPMNIIIDWG